MALRLQSYVPMVSKLVGHNSPARETLSPSPLRGAGEVATQSQDYAVARVFFSPNLCLTMPASREFGEPHMRFCKVPQVSGKVSKKTGNNFLFLDQKPDVFTRDDLFPNNVSWPRLCPLSELTMTRDLNTYFCI